MEKIWHKNYQSGVPTDLDVRAYDSVGDLFEECFKKFADRDSFHCMGKTISYEDLDEYSRTFASYLQNDLGLKKGARIALMMPNILQYPIAVYGILRAGMVAVNVNPLYTARELEHQLKDSGAETIVIFENSAHVLADVIKKTPIKNTIITGIGDMLGFPKSMIVNFVIKRVKKMIPAWEIENTIKFKDIILFADVDKFKKADVKLEDTAFLQYTGGTTGVSKGAELTHANIVANLQQAKAWISPILTNEQEIIITPLPMYHIFSLTANCFCFCSFGALNVLIPNPRDLDGFVKEISKWKFTAFTGVNTLFNSLLAHPEFSKLDFSTFKLTLGGGMAVQKSVADKWKEVTGVTLIEAYGLTETSPAACINPLDIPEHNGCIGLPISNTDVVIKDDEEKTLDMGEVGEICIKGPQVMRGYWNRPDETAKVMTDDGFFKTGDVGLMNENGFFKIVDRKKDMILVSGFNVYPNEIEEIVCAHPKVFESAAIGVPDERSGEIVKIFVVKKDDSLTESELKSYCKDSMTGYKVPRLYEFRSELPKSNVGKILRKELRAEMPAQAFLSKIVGSL